MIPRWTRLDRPLSHFGLPDPSPLCLFGSWGSALGREREEWIWVDAPRQRISASLSVGWSSSLLTWNKWQTGRQSGQQNPSKPDRKRSTDETCNFRARSLSFFFLPDETSGESGEVEAKSGGRNEQQSLPTTHRQSGLLRVAPLAWPDPSPRLQLAAAACAACCCVLLQRAPQATTRWALPALGERVCELTPPFHSIPLPSELPRAFLLL